MIQAAMVSLLSERLPSRKRQRSKSSDVEPITPRKDRRKAVPPLSPLPEVGSELQICLRDFTMAHSTNMTDCEAALSELEFTPDVIPHVSIERLCSVTGLVEGRVVKFQQFCKEWQARLEIKRLHAGSNERDSVRVE
jgi:hypothetical protein